MSSGAAIAVDNLKKSYGLTVALNSVSFQVGRGEIFGLIGPDGAGKTTLMRIACSLLLADEGTIRILGADSGREPAKVKAAIGYMPQRFSLYPDLSVAENLRFYADLYHVARAERITREERLMEFSRLAPFRSRRAGKLSGGMKQKLALCCTLIHAPEVLILDEPTTGVDPVSRREFWDILRDAAAEGRTLLVSTPYMDEAALCHRVGLIHKGNMLGIDRSDGIPKLFSEQLAEISGAQLDRARHALAALPASDFLVNRFGDRLHVIYHSADDIAQIRRHLEGIDVEVNVAQPSIEDTFVSLMNQRAA